LKGVIEMAKDERTLISFDWALKTILRQKDNFDILEGFLSDLLGYKISIIGLLESESNKDGEKDKFNRVDLKAQDSSGKEIIIEVQHDSEPDYLERVYYGTAKSLVNDMQEGYRYGKVKKIISVSIVYWGILKESYVVKGSMKFEDLVGSQEVKDVKDIFADYYFIQPKLFEDKIKTKLDEWVYLFKHSKVKGEIKATNIDKVQEKLDRLKMTESERKAYEEYQLNKTINEGVLQVREDKGIAKGKQQMIEAMRASGMTDEQIENVLKLSEEK
jgi:predicted transposase/invertase (TIGR01784 family)